MSQPCHIEAISSIEGMAAIAKPWNDLLALSKSGTTFLTWGWLYPWAECFIRPDSELFVLAVYNGNELIGIAPWCIRKAKYGGFPVRRIEFLGAPEAGSDYLDVFTKKGKEKEAARSVYQYLFGEASSRWDCLGFLEVPSESLFLLHFMEQMKGDGKYIEVQAGSFCPSLTLPKSQEDFLAQLSASRRKRYSRDLRILEREGEVRHHSFKLNQADQALKDFRELYQKRWSHSDPLFLFLEKVFLHGQGEDKVCIDFLNVNGRNIAGLLHLRYGERLFLYLMAADHSFNKEISVGNILVGLSIQKAIAEGFTEYNFLKGNEEYKFYWTDEGDRSLDLFFYRRRPALMTWLVSRFFKSMVKVLVR
jgi:CelD/BcsL family acetyltransferase involved in cellulose biosynthesis